MEALYIFKYGSGDLIVCKSYSSKSTLPLFKELRRKIQNNETLVKVLQLASCEVEIEDASGIFLYQLAGDVFIAALFSSDLPYQDCFVNVENIVWLLGYLCGGHVSSVKIEAQLSSVLIILEEVNAGGFRFNPAIATLKTLKNDTSLVQSAAALLSQYTGIETVKSPLARQMREYADLVNGFAGYEEQEVHAAVARCLLPKDQLFEEEGVVIFIKESIHCWLSPDSEEQGFFKPSGIIIAGGITAKPRFNSQPDLQLTLQSSLPFSSTRFGELVTSHKRHSQTQNREVVQVNARCNKSQEFELMKYRYSVAPHPGLLPFLLSHKLQSTNTKAVLEIFMQFQKLLLASQTPKFQQIKIRISAFETFLAAETASNFGSTSVYPNRGYVEWRGENQQPERLKLRIVFNFESFAPSYNFHGALSFKIVDTPFSSIVVKPPKVYADVMKEEWATGVKIEALAQELSFQI